MKETNNLYVQRLMLARCSQGTMDNYLNIITDHGVVFGEDRVPLLNANDHISDENVIHFGRCKASRNPANQTNNLIGSCLLGPLGPLLMKKGIESGLIGCKCQPKTPIPWENGNDKYLLDGAPALTMDSCLACYYGGVITLVPIEEYEDQTNEGQQDTTSEDPANQ